MNREWPPVLIADYDDAVQAALHLDGPLSRLDALLTATSVWHDTKHKNSPNEASGRFAKALARYCTQIAAMRDDLSHELAFAKAASAAGIDPAVTLEESIDAALRSGSNNRGLQYVTEDLGDVDEVIGHSDTPDSRKAA